MRSRKGAVEFISDQRTEKVGSLPSFGISADTSYEITEPKSTEYTHDIYKFPTKFIPEVPRWALGKFSKCNDFAVMDPFCGSGTTLVESALLGKFSVGIDVNPFCRLLSKVKTTPFNSKQFEDSQTLFENIVRCLKQKKSGVRASKQVNDLPELPNVEHWFKETTIGDLLTIRKCILDFLDSGGSEDVADFLRICLACILKKVSLADNQSPKPYVSRRIRKKPASVINEFSHVYADASDSLKKFSDMLKAPCCVIMPDGDARKLMPVKSVLEHEGIEGFDLMITSPPYINAYDLVRTFKLELFWLDLIDSGEIQDLKKKHIGTERIPPSQYKNGPPKSNHTHLNETMEKIYEADRKRAYVVWKFFDDMKQNFQQVFDLLLPGGHYVIVIGNSMIRGIEIPTSKILSDIGSEIGFEEIERLSYIIKNHYLRIPRGERGGKIKVDHISVLRKH